MLRHRVHEDLRDASGLLISATSSNINYSGLH
jgi:hypothetical protein